MIVLIILLAFVLGFLFASVLFTSHKGWDDHE